MTGGRWYGGECKESRARRQDVRWGNYQNVSTSRTQGRGWVVGQAQLADGRTSLLVLAGCGTYRTCMVTSAASRFGVQWQGGVLALCTLTGARKFSGGSRTPERHTPTVLRLTKATITPWNGRKRATGGPLAEAGLLKSAPPPKKKGTKKKGGRGETKPFGWAVHVHCTPFTVGR